VSLTYEPLGHDLCMTSEGTFSIRRHQCFWLLFCMLNSVWMLFFLNELLSFLFIPSLLPKALGNHQLTDICLSRNERKRCIILHEGKRFKREKICKRSWICSDVTAEMAGKPALFGTLIFLPNCFNLIKYIWTDS